VTALADRGGSGASPTNRRASEPRCAVRGILGVESLLTFILTARCDSGHSQDLRVELPRSRMGGRTGAIAG